MARLFLSVDVPDDITDSDLMMMQGVTSIITSDGIPEELHVWLVLAAAEAYERDTRRRVMEAANPLISDEVITQQIGLASRLALVDALMHIPMLDSHGVITPL